MSRVLTTIAIDDFGVGPLGVKEALVMAVEHLGGVQGLSVEIQEAEQIKLGRGGAVERTSFLCGEASERSLRRRVSDSGTGKGYR